MTPHNSIKQPDSANTGVTNGGGEVMNDRLQCIIEKVERERSRCIQRREEKVGLRDAIAAAGWDGKVQGLNMALAILREPNSGSHRQEEG